MNLIQVQFDSLRQQLATNFFIVVAALLVLAAVGAGAVYTTHVEPGVKHEEQTVANTTVTSEYEYSAIVQEENPVYPAGTRLSDRAYFFTSVTPDLNGTHEITYRTDKGDLNATTEVVFILESSVEEEVVWRDESLLATNRSNDGEVTTEFDVDIQAVQERLAEIEEDLGTSPGRREVTVVARTTIDGELASEDVSETVKHELVIIPSDDTYRVVDKGTRTATIEVTELRPVEVDHGPLRSIGSVLLLIVPLTIAAVVGVASRQDKLAPSTDIRETRFQRQRQAFDDWISIGHVDISDQPLRVEMEALEDLVDAAVDTDSRVIEDADDGTYYVVTGDVLYTFTPPSSEISTENDVDSGVWTGSWVEADLESSTADETKEKSDATEETESESGSKMSG